MPRFTLFLTLLLLQIDLPRYLLKYLMVSALPPPASRSMFPQPTLQVRRHFLLTNIHYRQ